MDKKTTWRKKKIENKKWMEKQIFTWPGPAIVASVILRIFDHSISFPFSFEKKNKRKKKQRNGYSFTFCLFMVRIFVKPNKNERSPCANNSQHSARIPYNPCLSPHHTNQAKTINIFATSHIHKHAHITINWELVAEFLVFIK